MKHKISVYIDTGDVFEYETNSSGREHSSAIVATGYRRVVGDVLTHYPPHRVLKVKVTGCDTTYEDFSRGT